LTPVRNALRLSLKLLPMWWSTQAHPAAEPDLYLGGRSTSTSPTNSQPATPPQEPFGLTMQKSSPIDIATPSSRHTSSSPSSQQVKPAVIPYQAAGDSRTSATMSGFTVDPTNGRSRQDSFAGAKPISMNNPNRNADGRPRRESLAGSLVGGMSWGGVSVGSWIRDE
jgi:transcription factor SFP1